MEEILKADNWLEMWVENYIYGKDENSFTCAHHAALLGKPDILEKICERAPELLIVPTRDGNVPAIYAALGCTNEKIECLQIIAKYSPESLSALNMVGTTPAHSAAMIGNVRGFEIIAQYAPETFFAENENGDSPAHIVSKFENLEPLKFLMKTDLRKTWLAIPYKDLLHDETTVKHMFAALGELFIKQADPASKENITNYRKAFEIVNDVLDLKKREEIEDTLSNMKNKD